MAAPSRIEAIIASTFPSNKSKAQLVDGTLVQCLFRSTSPGCFNLISSNIGLPFKCYDVSSSQPTDRLVSKNGLV